MLVVPRLFEQIVSARRDIHELVDDQVSRDVGRHAEKVGALDQRLQADVLWSADLGDGKFELPMCPIVVPEVKVDFAKGRFQRGHFGFRWHHPEVRAAGAEHVGGKAGHGVDGVLVVVLRRRIPADPSCPPGMGFVHCRDEVGLSRWVPSPSTSAWRSPARKAARQRLR